MMFKKAKRIWLKTPATADEYADFSAAFSAKRELRPVLYISADSDYCAYVNGKVVAFGQYASYPRRRAVDRVELFDFVSDGENKIDITVWYYGEASQTYAVGEASLIFEIRCDNDNAAEYQSGDDDSVLLYSDGRIKSAPSRGYIPNMREYISSQLGFTFAYDNTQPNITNMYESRVLEGNNPEYFPRPTEKTVLLARKKSTIVALGSYKFNDGRNAAEKMQNAVMAPRFFKGYSYPKFPCTLTREDGGEYEGIYFIADLGEESCGFLDFDIKTDEECDINIGYGEHLSDGRCRTAVRNFACKYRAKAGKNEFTAYLRRFGCRYIQFFAEASALKINYAGLRPVNYPVEAEEYRCNNVLREEIYRVAQNTLLCCMHEHYEDCPWREQALYTMDSRNQMLCGYYAFKGGNYEFARASLALISEGQRSDGLLSLCYPAGRDYPIPFFSLVYFMQVAEYSEYSSDISLAADVYSVLCGIIDAFEKNREINADGTRGAVVDFYDEGGKSGYWNFYEWSPTMSGKFGADAPSVEAPLNAMYAVALKTMSEISKMLGYTKKAEKYLSDYTAFKRIIIDRFYNADDRLFLTFAEDKSKPYSVLTNALCLLCGACEGFDNAEKKRLLKLLATNGASETEKGAIPNTLSMNCFRFDALIAEDKGEYAPVILRELDEVYLSMLKRGATAFYETVAGEKDFGGAGSLCHGWSSLPIYYYEILQ